MGTFLRVLAGTDQPSSTKTSSVISKDLFFSPCVKTQTLLALLSQCPFYSLFS